MNTYQTSSGERLKKSVIDNRVRLAKKKLIDLQFDEFGYNFCEDCDRSQGIRLDCSHNISVDQCQKSGRSELAYDVGNMKVRCRECHQRLDGLGIKSGKADE